MDKRGGSSPGMAVILQIMLSCYDGEGPDARRIFNDADRGAINDMPFRDFTLILEAINRVNGKDATEQELLRDFTQATGAPSTSD
jgi:hypothetical protein